MIVINRFRLDGAMPGQLPGALDALADLYRSAAGVLGVDLVQNIDEPELAALVTRWDGVGSYRRALFSGGVQQAFVPLLGTLLDEPSAYLDPAELGDNIPRGS